MGGHSGVDPQVVNSWMESETSEDTGFLLVVSAWSSSRVSDFTSKPANSKELQTFIFAAEVPPEIAEGFRALAVMSCGLFVSLANSDPDFREEISETLGQQGKRDPAEDSKQAS